MLRQRVLVTNMDDVMTEAEGDVAQFVTGAMADTVDQVKDAFRAQVRAAGLGDRLPNAVRGITYPNRAGKRSLNPTGWIYAQPSKTGRGAAAIIESYASGATIMAKGHRCLAIPTDDTPMHRSGDAMSVEEVESKFGRRLVFIDAADKGFRTPSIRRKGDTIGYLVMKNLVVRKASGRWRNASDRERAGKTRNPRPVQAVIMFTLVRSVKKPKSVDLSVPASLAEQRFPANLEARWR